ncbi:unnamed protein product [Oikopleura dioica]|uniref:Uncharacterized protein n=1 Tax=Oikopleura dioica TaxID=34765 RepID=E4YQI8_OIKDI|nr:unnamed protein product [Oikopleura dioica]
MLTSIRNVIFKTKNFFKSKFLTVTVRIRNCFRTFLFKHMNTIRASPSKMK